MIHAGSTVAGVSQVGKTVTTILAAAATGGPQTDWPFWSVISPARSSAAYRRTDPYVQASLLDGIEENAPMDSTTLLGLAGIGGTLLGTAIGAFGTLGAAKVTSRGQTDVEEQRARRQAYSACSTALTARRDAAFALLDAFPEDGSDLAALHGLLRKLDEQRDGVARAVGAAVVEGPYQVAVSADGGGFAVEVLAGRLRDWVAAVAAGEDREELVRSQLRYGREDQHEVQRSVDDFAAECRKVLHPKEKDGWTYKRARRIRLPRISRLLGN